MKNHKKYVAFLTVLIMLFCTACSAAKASAIDQSTLLAQFGNTKAAVCAALSFTEKDLTEVNKSFYSGLKTPETVEYLGLDFSVFLNFSIYDDRLYHIELSREYHGMSEACAKDIVKVAREMVAKNGKPKQGPKKGWGADTLEDEEISELYKKIINGMYSDDYIWYFRDDAPENVKQYIKDKGEGILKHTLCWEWDSENEIVTLRIYWHLSAANPNMDQQYN